MDDVISVSLRVYVDWCLSVCLTYFLDMIYELVILQIVGGKF